VNTQAAELLGPQRRARKQRLAAHEEDLRRNNRRRLNECQQQRVALEV